MLVWSIVVVGMGVVWLKDNNYDNYWVVLMVTPPAFEIFGEEPMSFW